MLESATNHNPVARDDDSELNEFLRLRNECERFRVLIMGKANAGKTTILQKLCETTEAPIVHDRDGNLIDPSVLENASRERGMHDIEHEITYESNAGYVFHDSRGFEAGSLDELGFVRNFIKSRAQERDLKSQLHVIWYCLPTDDDRPLNETELSFFQEGTFGVPVVAIFTKFDAQRIIAITELEREGLSKREARKQAPSRMQKICPLLERRLDTNYPPATFVYLQDMHKQNSNCTVLVEKTASIMNSDVLRHLLVTVQRNNLNTVIEYCIEDAFKYFQQKGIINLPPSWKRIWQLVWKWFPHIWMPKRPYSRPEYEYSRPYYEKWDPYKRLPWLPWFPKLRPSWEKEIDSSIFLSEFDILSGVQNKCSVFAGFIIIAAHTFWLDQSTMEENIEKATDLYVNSNCKLAVDQEIREQMKAFDMNGAKTLNQIVCANLMPTGTQ